MILPDKLAFLFNRRSVRVFKKEKIGKETIEHLLMAAMAAPSACSCDPWRFLVVQDAAMLQQISRGLPNGAMLSAAAAGIVVCGESSAAHDRQLSYLLQDCSAAIENLLLAASALGLGACWLGVHPREERIAHLRRLFVLSGSVIPVAVIALGYPGEFRPPRTRYTPDAIHWEKW